MDITFNHALLEGETEHLFLKLFAQVVGHGSHRREYMPTQGLIDNGFIAMKDLR
jgi:hypothetical protein